MAEQTHNIRIRHRLLTRLLVSHIMIVLIPLFITGNVLVDTAQDSIKETILERNLEFANRSTRFIDLKLTTATDLVKSQAKFQSIFEMSKSTQELAVNTLLTEFDLFDELSIIDTLGHVLASTSFETLQSWATNGTAAKILAQFANGESYRTDVYINDDNLPMLDIAEPVVAYGQVVGILYAVVDLKTMWDIVDENKVGKNGEAFIFNQKGVYIAHTDRRKVYAKERFRNTAVSRIVREQESSQLIYENEEGVEVLAAYAPIGDSGWGAMLQQPTSEAFASARRMRFRVMQFMGISVLFASLLAYFYSRWIVKPVNLLVAGMDRFSHGDLDYRIEKVTDDEIGTLAENFNEMAERLTEIQGRLKRTEVLETLSKLASVLSHEIRNPLNSMVINMQVLKREFGKKQIDIERVEKFYGILAAEIRRVDSLVTDFLAVARPPKMKRENIAIDQIVDDVVMMQVADSLNKGIRLERNYDRTPVTASVDVAKMRQVILNLTINAIQSMPGGGKLKIGLRESTSRENAKTIVLSFSDTGHGIAKEDLGKVFDFYYSTKSSGSGLGLAIVQQIVDEHQGKVVVRSKVEEGTTFTVVLPVGEVEPPDTNA